MKKKVTPYQDQREKKEQVEEMFDNIARSYDFLNHTLSLGIDKKWRKKAIKFLEPHHPEVIMDMATGTGDFAFESLVLNPKKIFAVDISEGMLAVGREKNAKKGTEDVIDFIKGDAENLPNESNSIDAITVGFGVRNFQNLEKGLMELFRVLKPGGKLAILEISEPAKFPLKQLYGLYFHYILPTIGKVVSKDNRAYKYLPESVAAFPEGNDFIEILNKTGFNNPEWKPLTLGACAFYTCEK